MFFYGRLQAGHSVIEEPVPEDMAHALAAAYGLMVEINCSPHALAVAAAAFQPSVLQYNPGSFPIPLNVPLNAVAPAAVAHKLVDWHKHTMFLVLVDTNTTAYGYTLPPLELLFISGKVCP